MLIVTSLPSICAIAIVTASDCVGLTLPGIIEEPGWSAGAFRRQRLAQLGDILIGVSGGQGVEQLAIEYSSTGKPVKEGYISLQSEGHALDFRKVEYMPLKRN